MAPVQQTFSLIPELPSALQGHGGDQPQPGRISRPPMTTKQAKKAYKAKNKGPKLSKAEQRRQDLMEQDRIRREFEKERNQARAKAARDKRKEKEEREKADKKKKGIPLFEVHPSQDTLARFVRRPTTPTVGPKPGGADVASGISARQGQSPRSKRADGPPVVYPEEDDSDTTLPAEEDEPARPTKRQRRSESPRPLIANDDEINDTFQKPITKPVDNLGINPEAKASQYARTGVVKEPTATSNSPDPDDPVVGNMVNRQILSESFSADDGLFDDIDLDAIELQTVAQHETHRDPHILPSKPPDPRPPPTTELPAVQHGALNGESRQTEISGVTQPKQSIRTSRDGRGHAMECENFDPKNLLSKKMLEDSAIERPSNNRDVATPRALAATGHTPYSGDHGPYGPKTNRQLQLVAEKQDRKPLQELPMKNSGRMIHNQKAKTNNFVSGEDARADQTPKRSHASPNIGQKRASAFLSPKTPAMGPPPLPPKFKTPGRSISSNGPSKPKFLPQQQRPPYVQPNRELMTPAHSASPRMEMPPSSTQLFLQSFADDLFPSPSQEIAELLDEPTSGRWKPFVHSQPAPPAPPAPLLASRNETKTHNQVLRSPVSRNNLNQDKTMSREKPRVDGPQAPANDHKVHTPKPRVTEARDTDYVSFLLTQDILLSSQDLTELEDEPLIPVGRLRPSHDSVSANSVFSNAPMNPQMQSTSRQNRQTSTITGKSTATTSDGTKTAKGFSVKRTWTPDAASIREEHADSLPKPLPGALTHNKPESVDEVRPNRSRTIKKVEDRERDTEEFASSFTDDELAELFSEDLEIEHDDPEPAASKAPSQVTLHRTPIQRHSSPKPFFTSSGTKEKIYLALEKSRTDAWRNEQARRQGQEELDILFRQEEEKKERILTDKLLEAEENAEGKVDAAGSADHTGNGRQRARSSSAKSNDNAPRSQTSATSSNKARQRSHPQGSYEKMLEMLEKGKQALENTKEDTVPASQGSDYSDFVWDPSDLGCL
ncbi:hypothetical protein G7054_g6063 [Neopestalotiopsis clavispora]|nr:hypothetical protein G7054_g6063 [Neopestalotiopsis clavispora]